jgi:hypothetical protein
MSVFRKLTWLLVLSSLPSCSQGFLDPVELDRTSLGSGLMAYYTFDDGEGMALADHSGNKRTGNLSGGQWIGDGMFAGALHLSGGANDHGDVPSFPDATENFSVSAWARASAPTVDEGDTAGDALLSMESVFAGGWQMHITRRVAGLGLHVGYWDTVTMSYVYWECACLTYDRWTHVAFVRSAADRTLSVYIDGVPHGTVSAPNPIAPGESQLHIGHWQGNIRYFLGDVDDVAIYGRALVPEEMLELSRHSPLQAP